MIHNVYILDSSGLPIVTRIYGSIEVDPTLIAGYISAQNSFFREITGQDVEMISTKDYNFWIKKIGKFLLTIVTSKEADPKIVKWRISQIQLAFIMNIEKQSLYQMIDSVILKSFEFISNLTNTKELTKILAHLLTDNSIVISGKDVIDVNKYIFTILGVSPKYKETYIYDIRMEFKNKSIIGLINKKYLNDFKESKYILYDIDSNKIDFNNLNNTSYEIIYKNLQEIILKVKNMDDITGTDFIRNYLKKIVRSIKTIREYIINKKKITFNDIIEKFDINSKELEIILKIIELNNSFLKIGRNTIQYIIQ